MCSYRDFNPRSPHGERRPCAYRNDNTEGISIHAPRTGSDVAGAKSAKGIRGFQSTLPARGATMSLLFDYERPEISIHAPRTGSDRPSPCPCAWHHGHFNPRSPHGERLPARYAIAKALALFQSTLPARGATDLPLPGVETCAEISIHAPRTGSDLCSAHPCPSAPDFNPRSPHGERPVSL